MNYSQYKELFMQKAGKNAERLLSNDHALWLLTYLIKSKTNRTKEAKSFISSLINKSDFSQEEKILLHFLYEKESTTVRSVNT